MEYTAIATSSYGLEAVVKRELISLGYKVTKTDMGRIYFETDERGIYKANLWLRTAERVLLFIDSFKATTFDELFDKTSSISWGNYIPIKGAFPVNGKSSKSKLFSLSDCQSIIKKAIVKSLKQKYKITWFKEDGPTYPVLFSIQKDVVTLAIDTSGQGLHKRGYRKTTVEAPLRETLAAALIQLSFYDNNRTLYDPFCGSGTIPIEAAMIARNIAPGLHRDFGCQDWYQIKPYVKEVTREAYQTIDFDTDCDIYASDKNPNALKAAKENALEAGVDDCISFSSLDFKDQTYDKDYGIILSNPPYGERLMNDNKVKKLTLDMKKVFKPLATYSLYFLTSYPDFERIFSKKVSKKRRLFNGNIEMWFYQYYGPRPPRSSK